MILLYRHIIKESKDQTSDVKGVHWGDNNIIITDTEIQNVVNIGLLYHRLALENNDDHNNVSSLDTNSLLPHSILSTQNNTFNSTWSQGDLSDLILAVNHLEDNPNHNTQLNSTEQELVNMTITGTNNDMESIEEVVNLDIPVESEIQASTLSDVNSYLFDSSTLPVNETLSLPYNPEVVHQPLVIDNVPV